MSNRTDIVVETDNAEGQVLLSASRVYDLTEDKTQDIINSEVRNTLNQLETDTFGSINLTGTNNTGTTITAGTFFYNNGTLVRAKTDIQNGSAITIGTNTKTVTAGGLNELYSYISDRMFPTGTISMSGIICKSGSIYEIIIYLPAIITTSNAVTITCSEFRPGGQTAVTDTAPTVVKQAGTNTIIVYTTNSAFASFVGAEGVARLTFTWN